MPNNEFTFSMYNTEDVVFLCCALLCVCCAALAAGMTIGLLSLDTLKLKIKLSVGTPEEKKAAKIILPILKNHHYLLCTLLLFNAGANEALPIFLDAIVPAWCAIIISVSLVLICGEVIPTAIFSGPHQLAMASKFTPVIYCLEFILSPIAYPMSLALDKILGVEEEDDTFNRDEMAAMVNIIRDERVKSAKSVSAAEGFPVDEETGCLASVTSVLCCGCLDGCCSSDPSATSTEASDFSRKMGSGSSSNGISIRKSSSQLGNNGADENHYNGMGASNTFLFESIPEDEEELSNAEITVIGGVLGLAKLRVRDICIPMNDVNMLSSDQVLNEEVIDAINKVGHSRLPVFRGSNLNDVIGFFIVKRLITVNPDKNTPLSSFALNAPIVVGANLSVLDAMKTFQRSSTHLALVSEEPNSLRASIAAGLPPKPSAAPLGILTVEDIFEAMLQEDIEDETDIMLGESRASAASMLRDLSMSSSLTGGNAAMMGYISSVSTGMPPGRHVPISSHADQAAAQAAMPKSILKKTPSFSTNNIDEFVHNNPPKSSLPPLAAPAMESASGASSSVGSDPGLEPPALVPGIPSHLLTHKKKRPSWKHQDGNPVAGFRASSITSGGNASLDDDTELDVGDSTHPDSTTSALHTPLLGSGGMMSPNRPRSQSHSNIKTAGAGPASTHYSAAASVSQSSSSSPRATSSTNPATNWQQQGLGSPRGGGPGHGLDIASTNTLLKTKGLTGSMLARHLGVKVRSSGSFSHSTFRTDSTEDKANIGGRKRLKSMHA